MRKKKKKVLGKDESKMEKDFTTRSLLNKLKFLEAQLRGCEVDLIQCTFKEADLVEEILDKDSIIERLKKKNAELIKKLYSEDKVVIRINRGILIAM